MRYVWGMLLAMLGAVLAFAVTVRGAHAVHVVGWILFLAGLFLVGLSIWQMRQTSFREVRVRVGKTQRAETPDDTSDTPVYRNSGD